MGDLPIPTAWFPRYCGCIVGERGEHSIEKICFKNDTIIQYKIKQEYVVPPPQSGGKPYLFICCINIFIEAQNNSLDPEHSRKWYAPV